MQIFDESQAHFSIYRTEVGVFAIGDALNDGQLFDLCRDYGDAYASLKFMVSHSSAVVHESPLDSSYSQKFYTIPPPVVVPRNNEVYSPVRSQHRSGSPPQAILGFGSVTTRNRNFKSSPLNGRERMISQTSKTTEDDESIVVTSQLGAIPDPGSQETPITVPVVPSEHPVSHLPEPELQITKPPLNPADSLHVHGLTLPVVEQAPGKLSDDAEPQLTHARTPDMMGSNGAVPRSFETECVISRPTLLLILNPHSATPDPSLSQRTWMHRRAP